MIISGSLWTNLHLKSKYNNCNDDWLIHDDDDRTTDPELRKAYSLRGIVVHMGSLGGGHYVAYIKRQNDVIFFPS